MNAFRILLVFSAFFIASTPRAQDVSSGPDQGEKVPALKVFDATGTNKDKEVDYPAERKDKLTIYVIIQAEKWDRPMARFLKKLDEALQKEEEDSYAVAVWLTENPEKTKEYLPLAQQSLKLQKTALTCFPGEKAGPESWHINTDAHLTAVVTMKGKVAAKFGYRSINETDASAVHDAYKKELKKK
jgi:menaquinone-dependent protoporphyrinogen IX oxidase